MRTAPRPSLSCWVYLSTWLAERTQKTVLDEQRAPHRLLSYAHVLMSAASARSVPMSEYAQTPCELFLDSGAFSAWAQGRTINLDDYADFILSYPPGTFAVVASLDVIPGSKQQPIPSPQAIEQAAEQGWENYYRLCERLAPVGIRPIHTFHFGEPWKFLERLLQDGGDYIGLGPGAKRAVGDKLPWLDECWGRFLTDPQGWPVRKVHGFGTTSVDLMLRYPWASVDSTSWVLTGRFGGVFVPLNGTIHKVTFSAQSPKMRVEGQHFHSYTPAEQAAIRAYLEGIDIDPAALATDYVARDRANVRFFLDLERTWQPQPFRRTSTQPGFGF